MPCGCGKGPRTKRARVEDARVQAVAAENASPTPPPRRRGEIISGSTWNGRQQKPAA